VYISHIQHVIEKSFLLHYTKVLSQYRLCRAHHAYLTYLMLQGSLVTWTVASLTTAKFKCLIFFMLALLCPIPRTCSFSRICMSSACRLHNFVIQSYTYGSLKAVCKSRTDVHLVKFPMVRRKLFYRHCNFKKWLSAADSQAGYATFLKIKVKVKVTLRLAVYRQPVRLGVKHLETHDQRFFPTEPLR
jgi:hypothetical protein